MEGSWVKRLLKCKLAWLMLFVGGMLNCLGQVGALMAADEFDTNLKQIVKGPDFVGRSRMLNFILKTMGIFNMERTRSTFAVTKITLIKCGQQMRDRLKS